MLNSVKGRESSESTFSYNILISNLVHLLVLHTDIKEKQIYLFQTQTL